MPFFTDSPSGASLLVRVTPRASRSGLAGVRGGELLVRLAAPPVDGAANDALIRFLADLLHVPRRDVTIAAGERGRSKRLVFAGWTAATLEARLAPRLAEG